jgi:hypothetical protein
MVDHTHVFMIFPCDQHGLLAMRQNYDYSQRSLLDFTVFFLS